MSNPLSHLNCVHFWQRAISFSFSRCVYVCVCWVLSIKWKCLYNRPFLLRIWIEVRWNGRKYKRWTILKWWENAMGGAKKLANTSTTGCGMDWDIKLRWRFVWEILGKIWFKKRFNSVIVWLFWLNHWMFKPFHRNTFSIYKTSVNICFLNMSNNSLDQFVRSEK